MTKLHKKATTELTEERVREIVREELNAVLTEQARQREPFMRQARP